MYNGIGLLALHRSTTVASDEALCIATLMKLDTSEILPLLGENKMCKVWDLVAAANDISLPCNMVFFDGSKLIYDYRWALSTLSTSGECFHFEDCRSCLWKSKPKPRGLMAECLNIRFQP